MPENRLETDSILKKSFLPLVNAETQILILGTMPGDESLRQAEYYAHPRNRFWKMMAFILVAEMPQNYEAKKALLQENYIGLWDVVHSANRKGSLDTAIANEIPNDLLDLLTTYPNIEKIIFNGKKAEALYHKYFEKKEGISYFLMPSTSPANATFTFEMICEKWKEILYSR